MDTGDEVIRDEAQKSALRGQARRVHVESFLVAALLTLISLAIPN